jgi:hypothetical protein
MMLAFARRQGLLPERCDINQVIRVIIRLLRGTLGEDVTIDLQLATRLWTVMVDRVKFEVAITNLATDARHPMPDGSRARQAGERRDDQPAAHRPPSCPEG